MSDYFSASDEDRTTTLDESQKAALDLIRELGFTRQQPPTCPHNWRYLDKQRQGYRHIKVVFFCTRCLESETRTYEVDLHGHTG